MMFYSKDNGFYPDGNESLSGSGRKVGPEQWVSGPPLPHLCLSSDLCSVHISNPSWPLRGQDLSFFAFWYQVLFHQTLASFPVRGSELLLIVEPVRFRAAD